MDQVRVLLDEAAAAGPAAFDGAARRYVAARALQRLGDLVHAAGNPTGAVDLLRASVRLEPHLLDNTLTLARRLGEAGAPPAEAEALYRAYIQRYPFHWGAREALGDLLTAAGRPADGQATLTETIRLLRLLYVKAEEAPAGPAPADGADTKRPGWEPHERPGLTAYPAAWTLA